MIKFSQKILVQQYKGLIRVAPLTLHNGFSSATIAEAKDINSAAVSEGASDVKLTTSSSGKLTRTAFASIQLKDHSEEIPTPLTDKKIHEADTVDQLLSISEGSGVSRKHALTVVSILSNWASTGKANIREFEKDPRFIKLCKILTRGSSGPKHSKLLEESKSEDLSTVLSITADEEAAKLVESITLPQMVKIMTTLSIKRRRSTLLLRTLAYNIAGSSQKMDIKQCADLFYAVSSLNFYDENLFERVANNVIDILQTQKVPKSAVVGSILTSVGLLKYKNLALLDGLSEWVAINHTMCRPQDIFSLFRTLGVLNHIPSNADSIFKILLPQLTQEEAGKPVVWLEIVWSLVLIDRANAEHLTSVLNDTFIGLLEDQNALNTSAILKLLNIDGAAHYLLQKYSGPRISKNHEIRHTTLTLTKEKMLIVGSIIDTMKNLIPENYIGTRVNTGQGFYIDAECVLDKSCNPLPLGEPQNAKRMKIAIMGYDYHDMCKGRIELTGVNAFSQRLLSSMGYRIVSVPYTDFKITDKVVNKVQYLESKLKEAVKQ